MTASTLTFADVERDNVEMSYTCDKLEQKIRELSKEMGRLQADNRELVRAWDRSNLTIKTLQKQIGAVATQPRDWHTFACCLAAWMVFSMLFGV